MRGERRGGTGGGSAPLLGSDVAEVITETDGTRWREGGVRLPSSQEDRGLTVLSWQSSHVVTGVRVQVLRVSDRRGAGVQGEHAGGTVEGQRRMLHGLGVRVAVCSVGSGDVVARAASDRRAPAVSSAVTAERWPVIRGCDRRLASVWRGAAMAATVGAAYGAANGRVRRGEAALRWWLCVGEAMPSGREAHTAPGVDSRAGRARL